MKEIKAYVHSNRVAAVIRALKDSAAFAEGDGADRHNLTAYMVKGSLLALDSQEQHYSLDLGHEIINEYKLELLCEDADADELVSIIKNTARTGQQKAGWIYVVDLVSATRID